MLQILFTDCLLSLTSACAPGKLNMKLTVLIIIGISVSYADDHVLEEFAAGNARFAADVYQKLTKSNSGNIVVCPLSVASILALVHAGARGNTANQISSTLHLPASPEKIQEIFTKLDVLQENNKYVLSSANKLYVRDGVQINDHFKSTAVDAFRSEVQGINFSKREEAAANMNRWVESKTMNKIKDLIKPNDLAEDTVAVLINAMYFEAGWKGSFFEENTKKQPFYISDQKQVNVDMMGQTAYYKYHESEEFNSKILELQYRGRDAAMVIVLPNDKYGLPTLEAQMADVLNAPRKGKRTYVHVQIPKFKIENTIRFNSILQELGIVDAFEDNADFTGILANNAALKISKVLQKAFIEVHEKGTTAAASSYLMVIPLSLPPTPVQFSADHPFIYYIRVKGVIIFVGRYSSPEV